MRATEAPIPVDIERRLADAGRRLEARPDVSFAYLFGGLATGRRTPLSDVDVAVFLVEGADPVEARLEILGELMRLLGTERIDLVVLNAAPLSLRGRILAARKILADNREALAEKMSALMTLDYLKERAGRGSHAKFARRP